jgi:hypothetical protein
LLRDCAFLLLLGTLSGIFLTLMDRIDEHGVVRGKLKTPLAYVCAGLTAASMAWAIELHHALYPLFMGMSLEWIVKNKINYPSHVFSMFMMTLYFGWRIDLLWLYAPYLALFLVLRYVSGSVLRRRLGNRPGFFRWYYASYSEKLVCDVVLALAMSSYFLIAYVLGFAAACLYTKKLLPEIAE